MPKKVLTLVLFSLCWTINNLYVLSANQYKSKKEELKKYAQTEEVISELEYSGGVSIKPYPNGDWRIFVSGTAAYDFDDVDEIQDAKQEAILKAKTHLSMYLKEGISTKESRESISNKIKKLARDNTGTGKLISANIVTKIVKNVKSSSSAILGAVYVVQIIKESRGDSGGIIKAILGFDKDSLRIAKSIRNQMKGFQK
jgi:hypothetical protein